MQPSYKYLILTVLTLSAWSVAAVSQVTPDYAREVRWANELLPGLLVGDPVYLKQSDGHAFLALYAKAANDRAVIVVHGMGLHPNWGMIGEIRRGLTDAGYTTLSLQMPVLAADASYKQYPALFPLAAQRLEIAASYLKQQGFKHIAIVSHSNGSRMTRVFMQNQAHLVDTWVALSLTQGDTFTGITQPVFDLYGSEDLPHVLESVNRRKTSLQHNPKSRQQVIRHADHFFNGKETQMLHHIKQYLDAIFN